MQALKVLYDSQIFSSQQYGGISRYFYELIEELGRTEDVHVRVAMSYSRNMYLTNRTHFPCFTNFNAARTEVVHLVETMERTRLGSAMIWKTGFRAGKMLDLNMESQKKAIKKGDFDLFHPTYYDPYFLPILGRKPLVITIYDMIHEKFAAAEDQTIRFKRELATRADLIIAISESTKRDIIDILGVPEEKIKVIYLGNSIVPPEGSMNRGTETGAYLLYVGYRGGYKNFEFMVNALNPVFDSHPNLKLICVGGGMFTSRELDVLSLNSMQGRTSQLTVPDSELAQLYAKAVAFICPSKYEGFGIPSLEAMSCGCPAVLSKSSSLPEVGGSAAKYFDPEDSEGLRSSIETLLGNETMRMKMKKEGLAQAAKFSWKNTTMETKEAYEALCQ